MIFFFFQVYNYEKLFEIMNLNHYWTAHQWLNLSPVSNSHRSGINGQCFSLFWQYLIADSDCSQGSGSPDSFTPFYPINPLHFYLNSMWLCTVIMLNVVNVELQSQGVFYPVSLWFFMGCSLKSLPTVCLQKKRPRYFEMPKTPNIPFKLKSSVNVSKITYHTCRTRWTPSQCVSWFSTLNL